MGRSTFIGDKPHESISLCVYGDETGLRMWNNPDDPMPIKIANGKTLEQCVFYRGGGITVYTDNSVTVKSYDGFYDYYLANERKMSEVMMLPVEGEEVTKDEEYYKKLINGLAVDYNKQVENAPNLYRNSMVLQEVNTPAPIYFACTVFADGQIWIGEGYSVGTADRPPCPVNVPSGQLSFVTLATSKTHSIIIKSVLTSSIGNSAFPYFCNRDGSGGVSGEYIGFTIGYGDRTKNDFMVSSSYKAVLIGNLYKPNSSHANIGHSDGHLTLSRSNYGTGGNESFAQLLIYKANLTETELKTENAKTIRLR